MKNVLLIVFIFSFAAYNSSCSEDSLEGFTKLELQGSLKCTSSLHLKETINKRLGTVIVHKIENMPTVVYFEDKDNMYEVCKLPEQYQKNGLIIMFSGNIYHPDPTADKYNPLKGLDFEITELWVKK